MIFDEDDEPVLMHIGVARRSGRYPWGTSGWGEGTDGSKRNPTFLDYYKELKAQGLSETDIAEGFGMNTTELRRQKTIALNAQKQARISQAVALKDTGMSNGAIAKEMGLAGESSVRSLLNPATLEKAKILTTTVDFIKKQVDEKEYIDVGAGVEHQLGISRDKFLTAVAALQEQGYDVKYDKVMQLGTGKETSLKVLTKPGVSYKEYYANRDKLTQLKGWSEDGGRSYSAIQPPIQVNPKRVQVVYKEDGGDQADGVVYVRPGAEDLSLNGNRYAQVRIAVGDSHYIKGMAMYKDDLPPGVDLQFNTNKTSTGNKLDALKPIKRDKEGNVIEDNPFGSVVRQIGERDESGRITKVTSAMNLVYEEGQWDTWSKTLSSQMLSKQRPAVAEAQLAKAYEKSRKELDEIQALTNPVVKQKLLAAYADGADSDAVRLKAAGMPRQSTHVILPINSLKETEIYAPNFNNGERVVLIRHPHGGPFEIPELTVNNNHKMAKAALGQSKDAVGINAKVAQRLSGADFDGDTVMVIPNNSGKIKTAPALAGLEKFDPQRAYPSYEGMKRMTKDQTQSEMGQISNLITDMTIRGASDAEKAAAIRHSMVVIDAEKHGLNYKLSYEKNGIKHLKEKYQTDPENPNRHGASTLISRAKSEARVPERRLARVNEGGPINKRTGEINYVNTGATYTDRHGKVQLRTTRSTKLAEVKDARKLSSGTPIEEIYAAHSNRMKALGNEARKTLVNTKVPSKSPSAAKVYKNEVDSLVAKLNLARANAPYERQAQLIANVQYKAKLNANPDMDKDEKKKTKYLTLKEARDRVGAGKTLIDITESEWAAIQAGAISKDRLGAILENADLDKVKAMATPKTKKLMTSAKTERARAMLASGQYTQAQVAEALGVSLTTLKDTLNEG